MCLFTNRRNLVNMLPEMANCPSHNSRYLQSVLYLPVHTVTGNSCCLSNVLACPCSTYFTRTGEEWLKLPILLRWWIYIRVFGNATLLFFYIFTTDHLIGGGSGFWTLVLKHFHFCSKFEFHIWIPSSNSAHLDIIVWPHTQLYKYLIFILFIQIVHFIVLNTWCIHHHLTIY